MSIKPSYGQILCLFSFVDRFYSQSVLCSALFSMLHDNQQDLLDIDAGLLSNLKICLWEAEWSKSSTPQVATLQKCDKKLYNARLAIWEALIANKKVQQTLHSEILKLLTI